MQTTNKIQPTVPKVYWSGRDLYWKVNIIDNPGAQIGHWEAKNPLQKDRVINTSKNTPFSIGSQPDSTAAADAITLRYGSQIWNSKDCFKYDFVENDMYHGNNYRHDWYCQFEC